MIIHIGETVIICSFRNGFGFDLEAVSSKPVHLTGEMESGEVVETMGYLDGLVFLLPFVIVMMGKCYVFDES